MTEVGQSSFYSKICFYQYLVHKYEGTTMKIQEKKFGAQPHNSEKKNEETLVIKKQMIGPFSSNGSNSNNL